MSTQNNRNKVSKRYIVCSAFFHLMSATVLSSMLLLLSVLSLYYCGYLGEKEGNLSWKKFNSLVYTAVSSKIGITLLVLGSLVISGGFIAAIIKEAKPEDKENEHIIKEKVSSIGKILSDDFSVEPVKASTTKHSKYL